MADYYVIDTHIVDYLVGAMARGVGTLSTDLRIVEQETAAFRLFLWSDLSVGRVALNEVRSIADVPKREALERLVGMRPSLGSLTSAERNTDGIRWRQLQPDVELRAASRVRR